MPPQWKEKLPEFTDVITRATKESDIQKACEEIKESVVASYPEKVSSRKQPMTEIRKAVREMYPAQENAVEEEAKFPYYFTDSGKGKQPRLEHLAIKYLKEEWNSKKDWSDVQPQTEENNVNTVNSETDLINQIDLSDEELETIKNAIGDKDVKEWIKKALIQQAKIDNALNERKSEDLSIVPSENLMTDNKYRTNPLACRELTNRAVRTIKTFNSKFPEHRWCITNALISEITGNTVKAIAKAIEGMGVEDYNKMMGLSPVNNRITKAAIGDIKKNVSIEDVLGIDE
jgi:hypothetical protein